MVYTKKAKKQTSENSITPISTYFCCSNYKCSYHTISPCSCQISKVCTISLIYLCNTAMFRNSYMQRHEHILLCTVNNWLSTMCKSGRMFSATWRQLVCVSSMTALRNKWIWNFTSISLEYFFHFSSFSFTLWCVHLYMQFTQLIRKIAPR